MHHPLFTAPTRARLLAALLLSLLLCSLPSPALAQDGALHTASLPGPAGSGAFGSHVVHLPNGNLVVTDPLFDKGGVSDVGAVYLYEGGSRRLISRLTGTQQGDGVGLGGVTVLSNGHFVVGSPHWRNGERRNAGAATWVNGRTGLNGQVSAANSLVGTGGDHFLPTSVVALTNGNYVVTSSYWHADDYWGAVTWGNGATGSVGPLSAANSLVDRDAHGIGVVVALTNGNYVVINSEMDYGGVSDVGAVTWGNGATGIVGPVSPANSLIGSQIFDRVGSGGVTALANGNYVVSSPYWSNGAVQIAGAATWGNGETGVAGPVSAANSLVGTQGGDYVSDGGVTALTNGNYVVSSPTWRNGAEAYAGAATWGNGATGIVGPVTLANSLVGSGSGHRVSSLGVTPLTNGNYVVNSHEWPGGAATWGNGATGITGVVSLANSLVGTRGFDYSLPSVAALSDGNYVVGSPGGDAGGPQFAGAVTWGNGATGVSGLVTPANSIVGSQGGHYIGETITPLAGGSYLIGSPRWDHGATANVGAITWIAGGGSSTGTISAANSIIGSQTGDGVGQNAYGREGATVLTDGRYVVNSPTWDHGAVVDAGALTWAEGSSATTAVVSAANSLVANTSTDPSLLDPRAVVIPISRGRAIVHALLWDAPGQSNAGAVTLARAGGETGPISASNSFLGTTAGGGRLMQLSFSEVHQHLAVGLPPENRVVFLSRRWRLTLAVTGVGQVQVLPHLPACAGVCSPLLNDGLTVTLRPSPAALFTGWSGACMGSGRCEITIDSDQTVSASFLPISALEHHRYLPMVEAP